MLNKKEAKELSKLRKIKNLMKRVNENSVKRLSLNRTIEIRSNQLFCLLKLFSKEKYNPDGNQFC